MTAMGKAFRSLFAIARLSLLAVVVGACATGGTGGIAPTATFTTLMPGWESKFSVDWSVAPGRDGTQIVYGRVHSHYGQFAEPFILLAQALDTSNNLVSQRVERVPGGVPGFNSTYYEISRMAAADHYKVTVWSYTFLEMRGVVQ